MKSFSTVLVLTIVLILNLLVPVRSASAQAELSEAFQKTVKKIARENAIPRLVDYLTEVDPVMGFISADLIGNSLADQNEAELLRSYVVATTNMLFLYRVQNEIRTIFEKLDSTQQKDILNRGVLEHRWDKDKLLAYSAIYYYYQMKVEANKLQFSPNTTRYFLVRKIEGIVKNLNMTFMLDGKKKKWRQYLLQMTLKAAFCKDMTLDFRSLELFQATLLMRLDPEFVKENKDYYQDILAKLKKTFLHKNSTQCPEWLKDWQDSTTTIFDIQDDIIAEFKLKFLEILPAEISDGPKALLLRESYPIVIAPINKLFPEHKLSLLEPTFDTENVSSLLNRLFRLWLQNSKRNNWGFGYTVSLAGSYMNNSEKIFFTVFDKIKYGYTWEMNSVYLFTGGFIDPILQSTKLTEGDKIYQFGLGVTLYNVSFHVTENFPYTDIKMKNLQIGVTIGYEIPLDFLFDE